MFFKDLQDTGDHDRGRGRTASVVLPISEQISGPNVITFVFFFSIRGVEKSLKSSL